MVHWTQQFSHSQLLSLPSGSMHLCSIGNWGRRIQKLYVTARLMRLNIQKCRCVTSHIKKNMQKKTFNLFFSQKFKSFQLFTFSFYNSNFDEYRKTFCNMKKRYYVDHKHIVTINVIFFFSLQYVRWYIIFSFSIFLSTFFVATPRCSISF